MRPRLHFEDHDNPGDILKCPICERPFLARLRPVWFIRWWFRLRGFPLYAFGCATEGCRAASVYVVAVMPLE